MIKAGKNSTKARSGVAKSILCFLLITFSLCQSISIYATSATALKKVKSKETKVFTIKSGVLPSSTKLEVINQELPWMEEIQFKMECDERPVIDFDAILRRFYIDLFRVITPTNAP